MGTFVIYTRVSKDTDGSSTSPAAQHEECLALARQQGWDEPEHLSDVDTSAWKKSVVRPSWRRVIEGVRNGTIDGLIVHHLDRMLRQVRDLEELITAIDDRTRGKFPIYSVHGDLDLSTPDGRFQARILTSVAQKESDDKSRRLKLVLGKAARDGKVHGGIAPYGWQSDRVTVEQSEADLIRRAVERVLDGESISEIARDMNARGVPTRKGGRWHATTLKQILTSPRLAGLRTHHGVVVAEGDWERIISPDVHRQLVDILEARTAHRNHHTRLTYWLVRVTHCGACGRQIRSRTHHVQGRRYVCRKDLGGCGLGIAAEPLEDVVATIIVGLIRDHGIGPRPQDDHTEAAREELAAVEARLAELQRDYYAGAVMDRGTFDRLEQDLTERIRRLAQEVHPRVQHPVELASLDDLNASERADLAAEIIERVVIHPAVPGRRFDPSRVEVWLRSDVGRV